MKHFLLLESNGLSRRPRHQSSFSRLVLALEIINHLSHRHPLDAFVLIDVFDQTLVHQKYVWPARDIGMNRHWEDELVILAIEVIEVVLQLSA
jgi:hypothetical protein